MSCWLVVRLVKTMMTNIFVIICQFQKIAHLPILRILIRHSAGISSTSSSLSLLLNADATASFFTVSVGFDAANFSCTGWKWNILS